MGFAGQQVNQPKTCCPLWHPNGPQLVLDSAAILGRIRIRERTSRIRFEARGLKCLSSRPQSTGTSAKKSQLDYRNARKWNGSLAEALGRTKGFQSFRSIPTLRSHTGWKRYPLDGGNAAQGLRRSTVVDVSASAGNGWQVRKGENGTQSSLEFRSSLAGSRKPKARRRISPWEGPLQDRSIASIPYSIPADRRHTGAPAQATSSGVGGCTGCDRSSRTRERRSARSARSCILQSCHRFNPLASAACVHSPADYYGTALHELAHWSGHPLRLNRQTLNESYRFGDPNYAKEELRAELASVFLAAERGIPHKPEQHAAYVGLWISALKEDKHEIFRAARDAHGAADFLLALERERSVDKALGTVNVSGRDGAGLQMSGRTERQVRRETSEHVASFEPGSGTVDLIEKETATEHRAPTAVGRPKNPERLAPAGLEAEKILVGEVNGRRPPNDSPSLDAAKVMTASALGENARLYPAHTDSGRYTAEIIGITPDHVYRN